MVFGVSLGTLGAPLVVLWGPWGLLWDVFGVSFGGLLAPLGHYGSLEGSSGGLGVDFGCFGVPFCMELGRSWETS